MADILLNDGNPLEDVANAQKISAVVLNGRLLNRSELEDLLAKAESAAKASQQS